MLYIISFVVLYRLSVTYKKELKENMIVITNQLNIHFNTIRRLPYQYYKVFYKYRTTIEIVVYFNNKTIFSVAI